MTLRRIGPGLPVLVRAVQALSKDAVAVGIPADAAPRQDPSEPSNATIGYLMETGVPERNIPARPFLGPGIRDASPQVVGILKQSAIRALKDTISLRGTQGGDGAVATGLAEAGRVTVEAVKARIEQGPFDPLAERTLIARRRRGNPSAKPLLDTMQMYDAITYRIRPKER